MNLASYCLAWRQTSHALRSSCWAIQTCLQIAILLFDAKGRQCIVRSGTDGTGPLLPTSHTLKRCTLLTLREILWR